MDAYSRTSTRPAGGAARRPARRGGARRPLNFGRAGIRALALAALGIVAGNATLFGVYSPFGLVAVAIAALGLNIAECTSVVAGALAGSALGGGAVGVIALAASSAMVLTAGRPFRRASRRWVMPTVVGTASLAGSAVAALVAGGGVSVGAYSLAQAVLSGAAAAVLLPSLGRVVPDGAAVLLAVAVGCAGLTRFTYLGASLGTTFGLYSCAVGGLAAGPGAAAMAGAAAGLGVGVSLAGSGELVAMLALGGAAVGAASRQGRAMVGFALLGVAAVCGYCFHSEEAYTARLIEAALAAGVLMVTPERVVSALARRVPQPGVGAGWPGGGAVHHVAVAELAPVSSALMHLAREYWGQPGAVAASQMEAEMEPGPEPKPKPGGGSAGATERRDGAAAVGRYTEDDPAALMAAAVAAMRDRACARCGKYEACWSRLFVRTYREFVDVLAMAEIHPEADETSLPDGLVERCTRQSRVLQAARELAQGAHAAMEKADAVGVGGPDSLPVGRDVVSQMLSSQLEAVAQLLDGIGRTRPRPPAAASDAWVEQEIGRRLAECGLRLESVKVTRLGPGGLEVQVVKGACANSRECVSILCPVVSSVLGQRVAVWDANCAFDSGLELCRVRLLPRTAFAVDVGWVSVPRREGEPCGDAAATVELDGGGTAVLVCDGMGVGEVAAEHSRQAAERLRRMLQAGLSPRYAMSVVNDLLFLGADGERFTTVDVLLFQRYEGRAEVVKAGAPPSYVRKGGRGGEVVALGGQSLPAGVAAPCRMFATSVQLEPGDEVFMITDGVLEAVEEAALMRFICALEADDARDCAEAVASWAQGALGAGRRGAGRGREARARSGSAAVAAARIAELTRVESQPAPLRDDLTVVAVRIQRADA